MADSNVVLLDLVRDLGDWPPTGKLSQFLMDLDDDIESNWKEIVESRPRVLYHYTTSDGLLGILNSRKIWATDSAYLNDLSEMHFARDIILERVRREEKDTRSIDLVRVVARWLGEGYLEGLIDRNIYYVVCFCESADLLSQWRYYGHGAGFALGFRIAPFAVGAEPSRGFTLTKVIYSQEEQAILTTRLLDSVFATARQVDAAPNVDNRDRQRAVLWILIIFASHISKYLASFKNELFREEREWRLVFEHRTTSGSGLPSGLQFRAVRGGIVPYIELDQISSADDVLALKI